MAEAVERTGVLVCWRAGAEMGLAAALAGLGLALPPMGRFVEAGGLLLARTGPAQALALRDGAGVPLLEELGPLDGGGVSLIDQSDMRAGVRLQGATARERLTRLVSLDLHPARFGPGRCAQTLLGHMGVLLLQTGPDTFELHVSRSYAASLARVVEAA